MHTRHLHHVRLRVLKLAQADPASSTFVAAPIPDETWSFGESSNKIRITRSCQSSVRACDSLNMQIIPSDGSSRSDVVLQPRANERLFCENPPKYLYNTMTKMMNKPPTIYAENVCPSCLQKVVSSAAQFTENAPQNKSLNLFCFFLHLACSSLGIPYHSSPHVALSLSPGSQRLNPRRLHAVGQPCLLNAGR